MGRSDEVGKGWGGFAQCIWLDLSLRIKKVVLNDDKVPIHSKSLLNSGLIYL